MKPYDPKSRCYMCGGSDIATSYHREYSTITCDYRGPCSHLPSNETPHMHRLCRDCGHSWNETPLNRQPSA